MKATIERAQNQDWSKQFGDQPTRNKSLVHNSIRLASAPGRSTEARAYLRDLRAAEMFAWEMTGGDFLVSVQTSQDWARAA
jgi:hypothetical protein